MIDGSTEKAGGPALDTAPDRRRPGRRDASPELIQLLRETGGAGFSPPEEQDQDVQDQDVQDQDVSDPLAAARGIRRAVVISAIAWFLAGILVMAQQR